MKYSNENLLRVIQRLRIYLENGTSPQVSHDIDLPLDLVKTVVTPDEGDDLMYEGYILTWEQLIQLATLAGVDIDSKFNKPEKYYYSFEIYGVYK